MSDLLLPPTSQPVDDTAALGRITQAQDQPIISTVPGAKSILDVAASMPGDVQSNLNKIAHVQQMAQVFQKPADQVWRDYDSINATMNDLLKPKKSDFEAWQNTLELAALNEEKKSLYNELMNLGGVGNSSAILNLGQFGTNNTNRNDEIIKRIQEINAKTPQLQDDQQRGLIGQFGNLVAGFLPSVAEMGKSAMQGATLTMGANLALASVVGPEALAAEPLSAGTGFLGGAFKYFARKGIETGIQSAIFLDQTKQGTGQLYGDLVENGVSHDAAKAAASLYGPIAGIASVGKMDLATGLEPIFSNALQSAMKGSAKEILQTLGTKKAAALIASKVGIEYAEGVASQEAIAGIQQLADDLSYNYGVGIHNRLDGLNPVQYKQANEIVGDVVEALKQNLLFAGLIQLPIAGYHLKKEIGKVGQTVEQAKATQTNIENTQSAIKDMPNVDTRVLNSWLLDTANGSKRAEEFTQKQADPETRTALWNETENRPETLYAGAQESDKVALYRTPEEAAQSVENTAKIKPQEFVQKVIDKYGPSAGEWANSIIHGKENLTDVAKDQLQNTSTEGLRSLAQSIAQGSKTLSEADHTTATDLGLANANKQVAAVNVDAQKGQFIEDNGRILVDPSQVVPLGAVQSDTVRIPKSNGQLVIRDAGGIYEALNPETKAPEAQIHYTNDNGVMHITDVPENPMKAKELLDSIDKPYTLDIPQSQKDAILTTDKNWRSNVSELGKLESESRSKKQSLDEALKTATDEEKDSLTTQSLKDAENIVAKRNEILAKITTREQEVLKEPVSSLPRDFESAISEVHDTNESSRQRIIQKITDSAPQITKDQADIITRLMDMNASAKGMTLEQWEKANLSDIISRDLPEGKKGAAIFEDGKAIIALTKSSDVSTLVHELGHIIRKNMNEIDQAKLAKIYGTIENDENFARDFEKYILDGKSFGKEHDTVFAKLAYWMGEIYKFFRDKLNPEVRDIMDRELGKIKGEVFYQTDDINIAKENEIKFQNNELKEKNKKYTDRFTSNDVKFSGSKKTAKLGDVTIYTGGTDKVFLHGGPFGLFQTDSPMPKNNQEAFELVKEAEQKQIEQKNNLKEKKESEKLKKEKEKNIQEAKEKKFLENPTQVSSEKYPMKYREKSPIAYDRIEGYSFKITNKPDNKVEIAYQSPWDPHGKLPKDFTIEVNEDSDSFDNGIDKALDRLKRSEAQLKSMSTSNPKNWSDNEKSLVERLKSEGIPIKSFDASNSRNSESKYITLENGKKIRLSSHDLPTYYENSDYNFDPSIDDPKELVDRIKEENSPETFYQTDYLDPQYAESLRNELSDLQSNKGSEERIKQIQSELNDIREARKDQIKQAINQGQRVETENLQEYAGEPWADEALKDNGGIDSSLLNKDEIPTNELNDIADELVKSISDTEEKIDHPEVETRTRKQANRDFIAKFDNAWLDDIREGLRSKSDPDFEGFDLPNHLLSMDDVVQKFAHSETPDVVGIKGKSLRDQAKEIILKNPNHYREVIAIMHNDMDWIAENNLINEKHPIESDADFKAQQEKFMAEERIKKLGINERLNRISELLDTPAHKATMEQIDSSSNEVSKQIRTLKSELNKLEQTTLSTSDALKSAREEAKLNTKTVLDQLKEKQATLNELRRVKAYKNELLKQINKPIPKSVDYRYAKMVQELQSILVSKSDSTKEHNKEVYNYYQERSKILKSNPGLHIPEIEGYKNYLDDYSIEDLENSRQDMKALIDQGKEVLKQRKIERDEQVSRSVQLITNNIRDHYGEFERQATTGADKKRSLGELNAGLVGPQYNFDTIDGGMDFKGPMMKTFYNPVSEVIGESLQRQHDREQLALDTMKKLNDENHELTKLSINNMTKHFLIDGKEIEIGRGRDKAPLTYDEAMGIYMYMQDEQSSKAVVYGNLIPKDIIDSVMNGLDKNWKDFGDWIIEHGYGDRKDALFEVMGNEENIQPGTVERYATMVRRDIVNEDLTQQLAWDVQQREGLKKSPADSFKNARIDIAPVNQSPIDLRAFSVFRRMIPRQENYIAGKGLSLTLGKVMNDRDFKTAVSETVGSRYYDQVNQWLARTFNPDSLRTRNDLDGLILKIKNNFSIAVLGYKALTVLKQTPGMLLYLQDAPLHLWGSIGKAATIYGFGKMYKQMKSLSPEMSNRVLDTLLYDAKKGTLGKFKSSFVEKGFIGLKAVDTLTVVIGWDAVFNRYKGKINPDTGFYYTDKEAAREADNATNRTQPVGNPKDQSALIARKDASSFLNIFGSAMNQIWGMVSHLPPAKRSNAYLRYMLQLTTIIGGGMAIGALGSMGKNDQKDLAHSMILDGIVGQGIGAIPLMGGSLQSVLQGHDAKIPLFSPFLDIGKDIGIGAEKGMTNKGIMSALDTSGQAASILLGLPYGQAKNIGEAVYNASTQHTDGLEFMRQVIWGNK